MTIHLPEDLENSVRVAVLKGQFASEDDLVVAAVRAYLRPQQDAAKGARSDRQAELTHQEMQQRLLAAGHIVLQSEAQALHTVRTGLDAGVDQLSDDR